ncbi:alpha/beta hydrolase [Ferrimonas balearica]|uniref:alpha/beta hydrolase n=1 Tax=Ferrimonas balearica TaxID=44012 RepID=UPI001C99F127|nr:alpha/beta hydrolase [Ferrimonas balearica]MBY5990895.1 alpha/beta hydrolase [Ferrimonas balearica]
MSQGYRGFTKAELEREYSPSSCIEDIGYYLDRYATLSEGARSQAEANPAVHCHWDCPYGEKPAQKLDLMVPEGPAEGAPLHLYIHGGYWQQLDKRDSAFAAPMLNEHGIALGVLGYTLAPEASLSDIVEECRQAIAWLYQHGPDYGLDPSRVTLSGSSAGGHLVAMMLYTDWARYQVPQNVIKGIIAVSGVFELAPLPLTYIDEPLKLSEREISQLSPLNGTQPHPCTVVLAYGDNETAEFKRQSLDYLVLLEEQGVPVTCAEVSGRNHFDVVLDLNDETSWLGRQLLRMA